MTSSYVSNYIKKKGNNSSKNQLSYAIMKGNYTIVKHILENEPVVLSTQDCLNSVIYGGNLKIMKALYTMNCPWNKYTCQVAACAGHIMCLRFAHANGCHWDASKMCIFAVSAISPNIKQWNSYICDEAKATCLKYAHKNGCIMTEKVFMLSAENGYLKCLKYAHSTGFSWNKEKCLNYAIYNNNYEIVAYINTLV
jgi:hypothetical protein